MATTVFEKPMGAEVEALKGQIGTLSSLTTTAKNNVVSAVNEVNSKITNVDIVDITSLITVYNSRANVLFAKIYKYGQHYVHGYIKGTINVDLTSFQQTLFVIDDSILPAAGHNTVIGKVIVDLTDTIIAKYVVSSQRFINVDHNGLTNGQEIQIEIEWYI